ncbi:putative E3 ubiquitin-protein ligase HERC6 isoform 2-T2 [Aulostomus maculatus]
MACGSDHCLVVRASGNVYSWGASEDGQLGILPNQPFNSHKPTQVPIPLPIPVIQVACGNSHSLALTKGGDVLSWGLNSHGQLGLGKTIHQQYIPVQVVALTGVPVTQISAGAAHTLFLTLSGLVYCCGANKNGQLGLNRVDVEGRFNICMVPALRPLSVRVIRCGEAHSAVLTKEGQVHTFGEGAHGQLGHNSSTNELKPRLVEGLDGPASQISCGRHHTLVLGSSGQLWAFGSGVKGQIGTGRPENSPSPTLVQFPWLTDTAAAVPAGLKIAAGWNTNFAFTSPPQSLKEPQITGQLDEMKLQNWLAMNEGSKEAQSEIASMFLTSSSLVASFTKVNGLPPEADKLKVDLEAASLALDQLMAKPWIKQAVNLNPLIEVLVDSQTALKSPEILLILPLCPLLQEDANVMNVSLSLAVVIGELSQRTLNTLRRLWSSLSPTMLMKHILVFHKALVFMLRNGLLITHNPGVQYLLEVLKLLYKANKSGSGHKVPLSTFYVEEINQQLLFHDICCWLELRNIKDDSKHDGNTPAIFCRYPFLFNLACKAQAFNIHANFTKCLTGLQENFKKLNLWEPLPVPEEMVEPPDSPGPIIFQLTLRRDHLVEDTFRQLSSVDHFAFKKTLVVQFVDERRVMQVNQQDLFLHVFDELMDPESNMFMHNEKKTLFWFPARPKMEEKHYFLFGVLCGLALYNRNIIHLKFPLVLFKKLLNVKPSLDDMREFEPVVGEGLRCILEDYSADKLLEMDTMFRVSWGGAEFELHPEEPGKRVTALNKKEFVEAFVNCAFNKSVEEVFKAYKRGFFKVCDMDVVEFFQPEELQAVMVGQENYDWKVFKQNTIYEDEYHAAHPNIVTFWEVFDNLSQQDKIKFFLFVTGSNRVPFLGMQSIRMRVGVLPDATELHFPEAYTCYCLLRLPIYCRYPVHKQMHSRLVHAINNNKGLKKKLDTVG